MYECLDQGAEEALGRLEQLESVKVFERVRRNLNDLYIRRALPSVKAAAGADLTDEQAEAIATDEDVTLVLAGAGTGKTKVIVGKVAHLIRNKGVHPSTILVLAYNTDAAAEIRSRLSGDLSEARVSTFNALGYGVIGECEGKKPAISKLAEDDKSLFSTIDDFLIRIVLDFTQPKVIKDFILHNGQIFRTPFDFKSPDEYRRYVNGVELRTLSGVLVKSHAELEIANYLTEHGVDFIYEFTYQEDTSTSQRRQYKPDFYLPEFDTYIEHFALDEGGRPPPGWKGYEKDARWKRALHERLGTRLLETYSWQYAKGTLLSGLRTKLENLGVTFERIPEEDLVNKLREYLKFSRLSRLLGTFLNHVKTGDLQPKDLKARARELSTQEPNSRNGRRDATFLEVFKKVRAQYENRLKADDEIDFHDQINLATRHLGNGTWESPYKYVLVDEFQDISKGRMRLLQNLKGPDAAYFLVGDDWQSIYRFAGSEVGLVRNCGRYLGFVEERTLTQTYRFNKGILHPTTSFIKRNPEQTPRVLKSASSVEDGGMTIVACKQHEVGLRWALKDINAKSEGIHPSASILVLGRYNSSRPALSKGRANIKFSTVHRAKGREADFAIIVDLKDGRRGFPSKIEDDPVLDLVLPPEYGAAFPFAEERRLLYVAMTRARIGAYLIADSVHPSIFIEELQKHDDLPQVGAFAQKCPRCGVGTLVKREGPYSVFMGCTEYGSEPSCRYKEEVDSEIDVNSDEDFWNRLLSDDRLQ